MQRRWVGLLCSIVFLAAPVAAQESDRNAYVEERVDAVRAYFGDTRHGDPRLVAAQRLLSRGGSDPLETDGVWGPATEERFRNVIYNMSQIGILMEPVTPYATTEAVVRWLNQVTAAEIGVGDWPD